MRLSDIIEYVEARTGHSLNRDEDVQHGDSECVVKGVTVAWMATYDVMRLAWRDRVVVNILTDKKEINIILQFFLDEG